MEAGERQRTQTRSAGALVLVFFFGSGLASLVLEVAWTRMLGAVFGNTVYAASTVLTAFMLGLALGSAAWGRVADRIRRPLLLYGGLELGIGAYALLFPALGDATQILYRWFFRAFGPAVAGLGAMRFILSLLILLPPAFLMGGTLPVLGRYLGARRREPGRNVGYLYALNTTGAVVGSFLAGFVFMELFGVSGTIYVAGGVALAVGLLAAAFGRREAVVPRETAPEESPAACEAGEGDRLSTSNFRLVMALFAVTGFCSMAYEVLWTRVLLFVLATSIYSFAIMLTTFLAGLALGSLLATRFLVPAVRRLLLCFGVLELLVGLAALVSVPLLGLLYAIDYGFSQHFAWSARWQFAWIRFADAACILLVPTMLMGAVFPVVATLCLRGGAALGRRIGQIYAANTLGCVAGAFAGGFVLLPLLGTHRSLLALAALNVAAGLLLVWRAGERARAIRFALAPALAAVALAAFVLTPSDVFYETINTFHFPSRISFLREHPTGTVTVHELPDGDRLLAVDGVDVAGLNFMLRSTQKLQGYIPLVLHPQPRRVLQIGWGCGETARVGVEFGVEDYTAVEICPAIFEAGPAFEEINHGVYANPRVRKIIMDGKNFAALTDERFDVIMNDSVFPGSSGSSALYTEDHFRHCRSRLAAGGLFSCWVPLDLRPRELRMILKSFQHVFPHTSFWVSSNCLNKQSLILGSLEPLRIDFMRVRDLLNRPAIAADLRAVAICDVYDFLDAFVCDEAQVRELTRDDPLNTDDRPRLEFSCAVPKDWELSLSQVLIELEGRHAPIAPYLENLADGGRDRDELARRFAATGHIFRAHVAQLVVAAKQRQASLELALEANPGDAHVASCQAELAQEIRALRLTLEARPRDWVLTRRLANKLYLAAHEPQRPIHEGCYAEAGGLYRRLVEDSPPPESGVFCRLAEILFHQNRALEAERILARCLERWPRSAQAHDLLGGICLKTGRLALAREHNAEAVRLAPGNPLFEEHRKAILAASQSAGPDAREPTPR